MDLRDAAAYHALVLSSEGASLATQRNYLFYWRRLIDYCDDTSTSADLDRFGAELIRAAASWYRGQVRPGSSRGGAQAVRQFVQRMNTAGGFLVKEGIIPEEQWRRVTAPRIGKLSRQPFNQQEIAAMWGSCARTRNKERDEALFLLLLDTGMRIGEAASLTLSHVDLAQHRLIVGADAKGKRERIVPVGSGDRRDGGRTVMAIRRYLSVRPGNRFDHDRLFLSGSGHPMLASGLSDSIKHLGRLAGVDNPIPHRLRHTFATQYLQEYPGDEIGLRRIVGHISDGVLVDYVHFSQSVIAERAGRVALSERWLGAGRSIPTVPAWRTAPVGSPEQRPTSADSDHAARHRQSR
jgi:integrase/recombinase XerD